MTGACGAPSPDTGMVRGLLDTVDCNVRAISEAGYGALAHGEFGVALTVLLTLYIGFIGFQLMLGRSPLRIGELTVSALKIGALLTLATSWPTYQQLVFDVLFRGPEQLGATMIGAMRPAGPILSNGPFAGLQAAYDELQASAAYLTGHSIGLASPLQGGAAGAALALNASALLMLLTSLGAVIAAKITLGLLLGLGPLFVALLLFDSTRGVFEGWLRAAVVFALAPLVTTLGLVVELMLIEPDLARLADQRARGLVDLAPANSILLLVLICTVVSVALCAAAAIIAISLRLPWRHSAQAAKIAPAVVGAASITAAPNVRALPAIESRAAEVAAAAAAIERRERRWATSSAEPARRTELGQRRGRAMEAVAGAPAASPAARRVAQPRRSASNLRRDR